MIEYLRILKPGNDTSIEEIKKAYRLLVKKNHPDLFPPEKRNAQNLILMEINEAFLIASSNEPINHKVETTEENHHTNPNTSLAKVKNEDYIIYKYGLKLFQEGYKNLTKNRMPREFGEKTKTDPASIIRFAITSIGFFKKSYRQFFKITSSFPDSIWKNDAIDKMQEIEKLNERYNSIIENLLGK